TQGGLSIRIDHGESASQPGPFSYGTSIVVKNTDVNAREEMSSSVVMPATTSVSDVIGALNAVGATPRDCISIMQAMKAAGANHAVLEII
ncbi:MAG: flagellar basal body P-ring protein FlgI, partial [Selenomonadaceae bacterium]|nr:flagellar basal body P-ring protein FlgI [Selenomonadaceae bacterium]